MTVFLKTLLLLSAAGSVLGLALMLGRRVTGKRLPSTLWYYAWLPVLLRLALPLPGLIPGVQTAEKPESRPAAVQTERAEENNIPWADAAYVPSARTIEAADKAVPEAPEEPRIQWGALLKSPNLWLAVWLIGAALCFLRYAVGYLRFRSLLVRTLETTDGQTARIYRELDAKRRPRLLCSAYVATPMLLGLFRPLIVLPRCGYSAESAANILRHELTHFRRGDLFVKWFFVLIASLHWFNPLMPLFRRELDRVCELSCDETVLARMEPSQRQSYGETLLDLAANRTLPAGVVATTFATEKRVLRERLEQIMKFKHKPGAILALSLAALVLVGAAALAAGPARADQNEPTQEVSPAFTTPAPERAYEPTAEEEYPSLASATDAEERVRVGYPDTMVRMGLPDQIIQTALREDAEYLYPDLYEVELHDIVLSPDGLTFSIDEPQDKYGFNFRAWYANGTEITSVVRLRGLESSEDISDTDVVSFQSRATYDIYWSEPVDVDRIVRIDNFGCALDMPVFATANVTDQELLDFFVDYVYKGCLARDFDTWADYVYFVNDTNREMARENYQPFGPGTIFSAEQLSDDLVAFLVWYDNDREYVPVLSFAGRYDGRMYVFGHESVIPDELRDGLENLTLHDPMAEDENVMVMVPDYDYLEEVDRELADFAHSGLVEVYVTEGFDETLPEDDIFGPLTLEDYIYGTDGWKFIYNSETIANDPAATIIVRDADGRSLWIMDDADALMIEEADGSITWVEYTGEHVDCADMIRHLLPWARGEYKSEEELRAERIAASEAALKAALAELDYYGLPDLEPVNIEGGETTPFWAGLSELPTGPYVTLFYGTDELSIDLHYERVYADEAHTRPLGAEAYEQCRSFFAGSEGETVTDVPRDSIRAFVSDGIIYYGPRIVWYDEANDLLFSMIAHHCDGGQPVGSYTTEELIALAQSVSRQYAPAFALLSGSEKVVAAKVSGFGKTMEVTDTETLEALLADMSALAWSPSDEDITAPGGIVLTVLLTTEEGSQAELTYPLFEYDGAIYACDPQVVTALGAYLEEAEGTVLGTYLEEAEGTAQSVYVEPARDDAAQSVYVEPAGPAEAAADPDDGLIIEDTEVAGALPDENRDDGFDENRYDADPDDWPGRGGEIPIDYLMEYIPEEYWPAGSQPENGGETTPD